MSVGVSRRFVIGGMLSALPVGAAWANAPERSLFPQPRDPELARKFLGGPERLVEAAGLSGEVSISVADVATGNQLEDLNGDVPLPPASVAKALTALYALDRLGPEHRFRTRLLVSGTVSDGVLSGDLVLAGGMDPTLNSDHLDGMAAALRDAGIRRVAGDFAVYDGALPYTRTIDAGQPDHVGYSPAISGIALNFNRVHFEWKREGGDYTVWMDGRTGRIRPAVDMATMQVEPRDLPVYTYADREGRDAWTVARSALGSGGARWLPVRRPAEYAGDVFRTLARARGVAMKPARVRNALGTGLREIAVHQSGDMRSILQGMLRYSTNITAEMVGMAATAAAGAPPASPLVSAIYMNRWAAERFGMANTRLVDHSGLGGASRMAATDLVNALVQVRKDRMLRPLLRETAIRDDRGRPIEGHPIVVHAKTGTLNFVSGLGGFMTTADGREMAFAILSADTDIRSGIARADRERPQGSRAWNTRAKRLQQALIKRWGSLYGA